MDRVVPALLRADRPRASGVARLRALGVVAALAVRRADRVDRREVDDVEAELGELRQLRAHPSNPPHERGNSSYHAPKRASGRSTSSSYVSDHVFSERSPAARGERLVHRQLRRVEEERALGELAGDPPARRRPCAAARSGTTRRGRPRPRRGSTSARARRPRTRPSRGRSPAARAAPLSSASSRRAVTHRRAERLVAVAEDPRRHRDAVADGPLDRPAPAVDLRLDVLDLDARGRVFGGGTLQVSPMREDRSVHFSVPPEFCSTRPRSPRAASIATRTASSTGSPPRASRGGRSFRSGRPTSTAPRTRRARPSPLRPSCSRSRRRRCRHASSRISSPGMRTGSATGPPTPAARRSPTRFGSSASGGAAELRPRRGVRLIGDLPIYVAGGSADHLANPSSSSRVSSLARRPTTSARPASCGETRSTTGPLIAARAIAGGSSAFGAPSSSST